MSLGLPMNGMMNDVMKRLKKTYHACGGEKWLEDMEEAAQIKGMNPFDAVKFVIVKKIQATRLKLKKRDEVISTKKGGAGVVAKLNHECRVMIRACKEELEKLKKAHEKYSAKKRFSRRKPDPVVVEQQKQDLELITKHVIEIDEMDKRRFKGKEKSGSSRSKEVSALTDGADDEDERRDDDDTGILRKVVLSNDLPDDPTKSSLPEIDISAQMAQVDEFKQKLDKGLDRISDKLDTLMEQTKDIGETLDNQNKMLDKINSKVEKNNEALAKQNERLAEQVTAVSNTTIYIVVIIMLILLIVGIVVAYVLISKFLLGNDSIF